MTEPRTPDEQLLETDSGTSGSAFAPERGPGRSPDPAGSPTVTESAEPAADSPTQAWPSLAGPPAGASPAAIASASSATVATSSAADVSAAATSVTPDSATSAPSSDAAASAPAARSDSASSPFEPADSLPATRVAAVGDGGATSPKGGRPGARWVLALVGILIVAVASFVIVSLVGGRPAASPAMGYMPASTLSYTEIRIDLPGDQRQKLAAFLKPFPGFSDPSAIDPKLDDLFDRVVRAATKDQQAWTTDIKPWFGGQIGVGVGMPDASAGSGVMTGSANTVVVITITDRTKAIDWLTRTTAGKATLNRSSYNGADLLAVGAAPYAVAVTDKVMIAGGTTAVKAAVDSGGAGTFAANDDVKAALATIDKDYVAFGVTRIRAYADGALKMLSVAQPGALDKTRLDETALDLIPAWQASTARFENDAVVASTVSPPWTIGFDAANGPSDVVGHVPAKALVYLDLHDVGPALNAILGKFRALDETKPVFTQVDQVLNLLGGGDAVYGWWGDAALVVSPLADGTIGGGLVIHPRDAALADRFFSTLNGYIALGGASAGVSSRTEDHNGTKITILDLSAVPGMSSSGLPPGYKPEFAWATNKDVAVMGYGSAFVKAVLDAGPGSSLGDDARFKGLLGRVGAENIGLGFLDIAAIRGLLEPLAQAQSTSDQWASYAKEIQPYLKPLDALIGAFRKDGNLDRGTGAFTVTGP